jgi:hypothetical protein
MPRPGLLATLRAMLPPILTSMGASIVGLLVVRSLVPRSALVATNDIAGTYLQTVGTIYAVLLAFVVYVVWQQFNELRAHLEREANQLLDLHRTVRGLPEGARDRLTHEIMEYANRVSGVEWQAMARGDDATLEEGGHNLDRLWDILHRVEGETECHRTLHAEAISHFNDVSDARASRISAGRARMPRALRILLYTGAIITVGSMYLFAIESVLIHTIMTASMAGAMSHVLYLIEDLDDCFSGDWQVSRAPFDTLRRHMTERVEPAGRPAQAG